MFDGIWTDRPARHARLRFFSFYFSCFFFFVTLAQKKNNDV